MEQRRTVVAQVQDGAAAGSERRSCRWLGFHPSAVRYVVLRRDGELVLRQRLRELAEEKPRWGTPMLIWRLRQEGVTDNHKQIRRKVCPRPPSSSRSSRKLQISPLKTMWRAPSELSIG